MFGSDILEKVSSRTIARNADRSLKRDVQQVVILELYLPPPNRFIPKNLEVVRDGVSKMGWTLRPCKLVATPFLGSKIPNLYFGDGFVAPLVQTGQRILGSNIVLKSWVIKYSRMSHSRQLRILRTAHWQKQPHDTQCS